MTRYFKRLLSEWSIKWAIHYSLSRCGFEGLGMVFIAVVITLAPIVRAYLHRNPFYDSLIDAVGNGITMAALLCLVFLYHWLIKSPSAFDKYYRDARAFPRLILDECVSILKTRAPGTFSVTKLHGVNIDDLVLGIWGAMQSAGWKVVGELNNEISMQLVGVSFFCKNSEIAGLCQKAFERYIPDASFEVKGHAVDVAIYLGPKRHPEL